MQREFKLSDKIHDMKNKKKSNWHKAKVNPIAKAVGDEALKTSAYEVGWPVPFIPIFFLVPIL